MTRARFVVRGLVQGVYFRAAAAREATAHGLTGRVWNTADGAVALIAEGEADALVALERWLAHGPRMADVEGVERTDLVGEPRYRDFLIAYASPE
ncbi:MAG TPA: acylphosphatase [Candidatus Limnocylindria bacterium]|jgi:acylphosphatase|nr:acylphosphatase [Candidatus Limnocylindria bacterium]